MSRATAGAAKRRRMSRADRERQMLDVAERAFAERGYHAVSMDDIAEQVGVTKPMLYEYFGSKDGLLLACIARCRAELYERTRAAMAGATDPKDVFWRGLLAYFEFIDVHAQAYAVLAHEPMAGGGPSTGGRNDTALPAATAEAVEATRRQQVDLIAPLLNTYAPDAPAPTAEAYAEIIIGACERLGLWRLRHPEVTAEDAARHMMNFSWYGLAQIVATLQGR
ncbi:MAG TPA: helix-turn-helix domain-containing protein [Streptosporangiaceae bacterium]